MKTLLFILFCILSIYGFSQESLQTILEKHNTKNIPYTTVWELAMPKTEAIILDAREQEEFETSHLKDALFVGYNNFSLADVIKKIPNKDEQIIVYCSVGIRSENIAFKLKKAGYKNVSNLYGGIFEWKNNQFPVYNSKNKETEKVHTYNKTWSKWLTSGIKVY